MFRTVVSLLTFLRARRSIAAWSIGVVLLVVGLGALIGMPPFGFVVILLGIFVPTSWVVIRGEKRAPASVTAKMFVAILAAATAVTFLAIQAIPYGRSHSNPPVTGEPQWANDETRELMVRACFGCHSNEVEYPAYASVAPISWVVQSHVDEGRGKVNYSEYDRRQRGAHETLEVIAEGEMPPHYYTLFGLHPEAKLTESEVQALIAGIKATPGLAGHDD